MPETPVTPAPSPMFDTHEKELKNASTIGMPVAVNNTPPKAIIMTYRQRNAITLSTVSGDMIVPLILTERMEEGIADGRFSRRRLWSRRMPRKTSE